MTWQHFDLKTLETEYSPSSMVQGNYQPYLSSYAELSAAARANCRHQLGLRYGTGERALIDFFPAESPTGELLVFFHGGYWQESSREDSALLAPAWTAKGVSHAVVGYDLAPTASLSQIIEQCHHALLYLANNAKQLKFNNRQIVLAGSSAGAHLAMMLCLLNDHSKVPLKAAILLSGIYDLEPLVPTYVNQALALSAEQARALSPHHLLDSIQSSTKFPTLLIAFAEHDTAEFRRQSREFAAQLRARGVSTIEHEELASNHFSILNRLGEANSTLFLKSKLLFECGNASS